MAYDLNTNSSNQPYLVERPLKIHEMEMLALMKSALGENFVGDIIDVGCADGLFCAHLATTIPGARIHGVDSDAVLIGRAQTRTGFTSDIGDARSFFAPTGVDALHASGILSVFHDPYPVLDHWLSLIRPGGWLFLFGAFNSRPIDTQVLTRNHYCTSDWEGGLTSYYVEHIKDRIFRDCVDVTSHAFRLAIDIPEGDDPMRTYTHRLQSGEILITNGSNMISEFFHITARKRSSGHSV